MVKYRWECVLVVVFHSHPLPHARANAGGFVDQTTGFQGAVVGRLCRRTRQSINVVTRHGVTRSRIPQRQAVSFSSPV